MLVYIVSVYMATKNIKEYQTLLDSSFLGLLKKLSSSSFRYYYRDQEYTLLYLVTKTFYMLQY